MLHGFLRQATAAQSRLVGPFLDDTDFKTAKTALTVANTDVKLSVAGAAGANKNSGGGTHRNNGMYSLTFDATDTATVGELAGSIVVASALEVVFKFLVIEEAIYDALFAASAAGFDASGRVDIGKVVGVTAAKLAAHLPAILQGLTTSGSSATTVVANATTGVDGGVPSAVDNFYNGRVIIFTSGALVGQATAITDYTGSTQTFTVTTMTGTPASGVTFVIV